MIGSRQHVVGWFWVPKYDPVEFPLTPAEVDILRRHFTVRVESPELLFLRLISLYLLRRSLGALFRALDRVFYKVQSFRRRSYRQYLLLS